MKLFLPINLFKKERTTFPNATYPVARPNEAINMEEYVKDNSPVQNKTISLTSAQIKTLGTPLQLLPAPGPNKLIRLISATFISKFKTTQYTSPGTYSFGFKGATTFSQSGAITAASIFPTTNDNGVFYYTATNINHGSTTSGINEALTFLNNTGNPTVGAGSLKIALTYVIEDFS